MVRILFAFLHSRFCLQVMPHLKTKTHSISPQCYVKCKTALSKMPIRWVRTYFKRWCFQYYDWQLMLVIAPHIFTKIQSRNQNDVQIILGLKMCIYYLYCFRRHGMYNFWNRGAVTFNAFFCTSCVTESATLKTLFSLDNWLLFAGLGLLPSDRAILVRLQSKFLCYQTR